MKRLGSLFDGFVSLNDDVPQNVNYTVAGFNSRMTEAALKVGSDLGSVSSFSKVAVSLPSVDSLKSSTVREIADGAGAPLSQEEKQQIIGLFAQDTPETFSASQINAITGKNGAKSGHEVYLIESGMTINSIYFEVMPEITENRNVDYEAIAPAQFPGAFQKYKGTQSTTWNINAKLTARNTLEATERYKELSMMRGWTLPFFGKNTGAQFPKKLGAPPPVLKFGGWRGLVGEVPVVMTALNWQWPSDVDYIPTSIVGSDGQLIPFPTVMNIQITLVESFSTEEFNSFSLLDYRAGRMAAAYGNRDRSVTSQVSDPAAYTQPVAAQPKPAAVSPARKTAKKKIKKKTVPKKLPPLICERTPPKDVSSPIDTSKVKYDQFGNVIGKR